jgi:hypothetical protein
MGIFSYDIAWHIFVLPSPMICHLTLASKLFQGFKVAVDAALPYWHAD